MCYDTEHDRRNSRVVTMLERRCFQRPPVQARSLTIACATKWAKDLPKDSKFAVARNYLEPAYTPILLRYLFAVRSGSV